MRSIACEVCGSLRHRFLFKGRDRLFGLPGIFTIVKCKECGLLFMNPQPEKKTLREYYPAAYHATQPSRYHEYSRLRKLVLKTYFGYDKNSDASKTVDFLRKIILIPFRFQYRRSIPFVENGRLLDVGCGNGTELYKLKSMGWETYGVELDEEAVTRARSKGLNIFTGDLLERNFPDQFFDVVRMSFVLEHLPNPRETLQEIKRILRSQGRIYISIQNARSLHYWLFSKRWFSLDIPRHLFTFNPQTMKRLLSSLDMKIETIHFDSGTRSFLVSLQYWVNDLLPGGAFFQARKPIAKSRLLKYLFRPPCWLIDRIRLGDLIHLEVVPR